MSRVPKIKVHVEEVREALDTLARINQWNLEDIDLYYDLERVVIPRDHMERWSFIGLNITEYINEFPDNPLEELSDDQT